MDNERDDAADLIESIGRDVEKQIGDLEAEAETYGKNRRETARAQAREILRKAEASANLQCEILARNAESKAAIERRKTALRVREQVLQETLEQARRIVTERLASPEYAGVLKNWIVEASVGLSVPEASVNASKEELPLITDALLRDAEAEAEALTGKSIRLKGVEGDPLPVQGILLTAKGGHLAYNNQVPTRFLRAQTAIRKRIHAVLFGEVEHKVGI